MLMLNKNNTSKTICIGDSHVRVFKDLASNVDLVYHVDGATNLGLKNPNSKTKAKPIFDNFLKFNLNTIDTLIFMMG